MAVSTQGLTNDLSITQCNALASENKFLNDTYKTSKALNTRGLREYKKGHLKKARNYFYCAQLLSPNYALAHYNYAATLALLDQKTVSDPCYNPTLEDMEKHLVRSIQLDSGRRQRLKNDSDFDNIRDGYFYKYVTFDIKQEKISDLFYKVGTWHAQTIGVLPVAKLIFENESNVLLKTYKFKASRQTSGWSIGIPAIYSIDGNTLSIEFKNNKLDSLNGEIRFIIKKNVLLDIEISTDKFGIFKGYQDDCNA
ncbi:tetratricopeptide repeat protein [Zooshikella sp. RANM57]|uniref:tetratricopeptide repeat protein n=1 Tax=Zooshikella sp. RANM57 TaxID=3425863 RepID=UPI003D6F6D0B